MGSQPFSLKNFKEDTFLFGIEIKGNIERRSNTLFASYEIAGDLSKIIVPEKKIIPSRRYNLWENTCLELFIAIKDLPKYWEFNFSPSGDWNVFYFKSYRNEGFGNKLYEEGSFLSLPFISQRDPEKLKIKLECDLDVIVRNNEELDIGISAVVEFRNYGLSYWALKHFENKPNFHTRDSFVIGL
jgi:hypothetical protein